MVSGQWSVVRVRVRVPARHDLVEVHGARPARGTADEREKGLALCVLVDDAPGLGFGFGLGLGLGCGLGVAKEKGWRFAFWCTAHRSITSRDMRAISSSATAAMPVTKPRPV